MSLTGTRCFEYLKQNVADFIYISKSEGFGSLIRKKKEIPNSWSQLWIWTTFSIRTVFNPFYLEFRPSRHPFPWLRDKTCRLKKDWEFTFHSICLSLLCEQRETEKLYPQKTLNMKLSYHAKFTMFLVTKHGGLLPNKILSCRYCYPEWHRRNTMIMRLSVWTYHVDKQPSESAGGGDGGGWGGGRNGASGGGSMDSSENANKKNTINSGYLQQAGPSAILLPS